MSRVHMNHERYSRLRFQGRQHEIWIQHEYNVRPSLLLHERYSRSKTPMASEWDLNSASVQPMQDRRWITFSKGTFTSNMDSSSLPKTSFFDNPILPRGQHRICQGWSSGCRQRVTTHPGHGSSLSDSRKSPSFLFLVDSLGKLYTLWHGKHESAGIDNDMIVIWNTQDE